ncbi:MAG: UTP--glucose-1-phosphate uridylyltransferase [Spirochaetales bacterium]|jgi:UDP-N-acetylglucosamine pyrophosphorylase|nr:UTP--glucose-1-phosphate uridylyltransferase [Spirochaetales bacterium]
MNRELSAAIRQAMEEQGIDARLTLNILNAWNSGKSRQESVRAGGFPAPDGKTILDMTRLEGYSVSEKAARRALAPLLPGIRVENFSAAKDGTLFFPRESLETLGTLLFPYVSFGVLNGGSATSYCDTKKNEAFSARLFNLLRGPFGESAAAARGRPKGITPAYANPCGSPGRSFLELKLRNLLLQTRRWRALVPRFPGAYGASAPGALEPFAPVFQMTSVFTNADIAEAFQAYKTSPLLEGLIAETGVDITRVETGVQPLIAAFTSSSAGERREIFTNAWGKPGSVLGLPGGHGQNFLVLKDIYRRLREAGKRFVYLGNVDNLGFTPDPAGIAVLALSGSPAGFDFAFKTAVDTKGGVLVRDSRRRLTCADIGPAVSAREVAAAEQSGIPILFNAATGLFDLDYLVTHRAEISAGIPLRWSDQDKDAGRYSQAEQVTWEVIGLLDNPLIFGVDKFRRFLAAKLLLESLMTSGLGLESEEFPENLRALALALREGFVWNMENSFGMKLSGGVWTAAEEISGSSI